MISRRAHFVGLLTLCACLIPTASASAAEPKWELDLSSVPAGFIDGASGDPEEGPAYRIVAANVGDAPTSGPYTITGTLPAEVTPAAGVFGEDSKGNALSCGVNGQTVTCTATQSLEPAFDFEPQKKVGDTAGHVEAVIPVDVPPGTSGTIVHSEAKIEGGGATTVTAELDTAIGVPAWQLIATPLPTNFTPGAEGQEILLVATNVGGAPTAGEITVTDTLPDGLTPTFASGLSLGSLDSPGNVDCGVDGQTATCTMEGPLVPGGEIMIRVLVDVAPDAPPSVQNEASVGGGGAFDIATTGTIEVSPTPAGFGFLAGDAGLNASAIGDDGSPVTQAGAHPHQMTINLGFPTEKFGNSLGAAGHLRDAFTDLPRGTVVNPRATPVLCTEFELTISECPDASQVGTATVITVAVFPEAATSPLYNMVPPPGKASSFGFDALGVGVFPHIIGSVRSDGDYGLSGGATDALAQTLHPIFGVRIDLWGNPSGPSHDAMRGWNCQNKGGSISCPVERQDTALLTMPVECTGSPTITRARARSWEEPEVERTASYVGADLSGNPVAVDGCNQLEFEPTIEAKPTTNLADAPSGLDFNLHQPQNTDLDGLSTAIARDVTLTLPEGMSVNPSSADGLGSCSPAQSNFHTTKPSQCPSNSKLGTIEATTPLLDHPVEGALYLAEPFNNPQGSLIALYLAVHDKETGVVANLSGRVTPNPDTGQLATTFRENPQLPLEDVRVKLFTGPRASLRTPPACATYTARADITPWSTPETKDAHPTDSFAITAGPAGAPCPSSASSQPHSPTFSAGTLEPVAGAYSPFLLRVTRNDATQPLSGIEATLPPGLTGKLAGIGMCSEAQLAQAKAREAPNKGKLEKQSPSCPASSEVGEVTVGAGAGIAPLHVKGTAYLAGPYKGAPLSLAIITPAVAGPFDLGAVVVRTALYVDPKTTQIHAVSDPLPQALEGIPLDVRTVSLRMARPEFTRNPTSCDPMQIDGLLSSSFGLSAALSSPFQVGACSSLPFKPKLGLRLKGGTKRGDNPKLIATLKGKPNEAGIASTSVTLPRSAFLDQGHIRTICTRVQFAADACPKGSIYGKASATTPLLDYPVSGPVYLRSSDNQLPDLVIALKGPEHQPIKVELAGRTDSVKGALRNTFDVVPDAPVSRFRLELLGGKRGLVTNSRNICARTYRATVEMVGQNGKLFESSPAVANDCKKRKRGKGKRRR